MLKKLANKLSEYPGIYTFLRKVIEFDFRSHKSVIFNELSDSGQLLDIACGIGEFSIFFDNEKYTGVDLSESYIKYGRNKYKKNLIIGDARKLDFKDASFDSVLISGFFHHLNDEDTNIVLSEAHRVLKDGGRLLIIEDAPGKNFISKKLQKYDVGANIREISYYIPILTKKFNLEKAYPMKSGLWYYSVFLLRK